ECDARPVLTDRGCPAGRKLSQPSSELRRAAQLLAVIPVLLAQRAEIAVLVLRRIVGHEHALALEQDGLDDVVQARIPDLDILAVLGRCVWIADQPYGQEGARRVHAA